MIDFDLPDDTITLLDDITITRSVEIHGPGADELEIIRDDTAGDFRIFTITSGTVTISGLTISNGEATDEVIANFNYGGGIRIGASADLTIVDSVITGNAASETYGIGGGIFTDGDLIIINSTISDNSAGETTWDQGGGIYASATASVAIEASTISGNSAVGAVSQGGGVWSAGTTTIVNSTIAENTATTGGGIYTGGGTLSVTASTLAYNSATVGSNLDAFAGSTTLATSIIAEADGAGSNSIALSIYRHIVRRLQHRGR